MEDEPDSSRIKVVAVTLVLTAFTRVFLYQERL